VSTRASPSRPKLHCSYSTVRAGAKIGFSRLLGREPESIEAGVAAIFGEWSDQGQGSRRRCFARASTRPPAASLFFRLSDLTE
jgi:hypothetical protein